MEHNHFPPPFIGAFGGPSIRSVWSSHLGCLFDFSIDMPLFLFSLCLSLNGDMVLCCVRGIIQISPPRWLLCSIP